MSNLDALKRSTLERVAGRERSERVRFEAGLGEATRAACATIEAAATEGAVYRAIADYTDNLARLRGVSVTIAGADG